MLAASLVLIKVEHDYWAKAKKEANWIPVYFVKLTHIN